MRKSLYEAAVFRASLRYLKETKGITYAAMAREMDMKPACLRNFTSGYRDSLGDESWRKIKKYLQNNRAILKESEPLKRVLK